MGMKVQKTFWGVISILGIGFIAIALSQPDRLPIFYRVVYSCVILIGMCAIWSYFSLRGISVKRTARLLRLEVGQVFEERFEIDNYSPFLRLWVEVRDECNLPGKNSSRVLSWIGPHQHRSYLTYTILTQRGQFPLGPTSLISGDPFGLFSNKCIFQNQQELLVLPLFHIIQNFPSPVGFLPGGRALRKKTQETTPYAAGVREYVAGDALNRIHWPTTARRDRMMVKEFEQDPMADIWIFIDAEAQVQAAISGEKPVIQQPQAYFWWRKFPEIKLSDDTFEYAISMAASLAHFFIRQNRAVGLVSAGKILTVLAAERGERQLYKIFETLSFLHPEGMLPIQGLVDAQLPHLARGSTAILITPSSMATVEIAVESILERDLKPVVILLDSSTFGHGMENTSLQNKLTAHRIPVSNVKCGMDLQKVMETGFPPDFL
jgi:uncharacterized protein (DUF58 family)